MKYDLKLTGVPVISKKNRLKFGRGRTYKPTEVIEFESALRKCAEGLSVEPLSGDLTVEIVVVVPDKRRRDLQNFSDTICDALNGVLYEDDSQITTLLMRKVWGKEWELLISVGQN